MHLRKLVSLFGVLLLCLSSSVFALGLGTIKLNSALNQPLDAHISLQDVGDLGANQIKVNIASQKAFDRVGLERSFFYTQLRFNVILKGPGAPFIAVTSKDPVREPYLSFIVEVRWSSGRVLREYTVLLDLPTFDKKSSPKPVHASVTSTAKSTRPVASSHSSERPAAEPNNTPARSQHSYGADTYGPVASGDTLWDVALQVRPSNASVQQTMLAIQRANPDAFIHNNINLLRKGQVLRIPAANKIRSIGNRQAISQVAEQNRQWSGKTMGAQLDAANHKGSVSRASRGVTGHLKLASPGGNKDSGAGQGETAGSSNGSATSAELAAAQEELERTRGENTELHSRIDDLKGQIDTMQRLLKVSNKQLHALQAADNKTQDSTAGNSSAATDSQPQASADTDTDTANDAANKSTAPNTAADTDTAATQAAANAADTAIASSSSSAAASKPAKAAAKVKKVVRRAPETSLMDKLMDHILWVALAVVALLGVIFFFVHRHATASMQVDDDELEEDFSAEDDFSFEEDDAAGLDEQDGVEEPTEEAVGEDSGDEEPIEAETGDVASEAEIYIAYGKYDQAEDMLRKGLQQEPESLPIKLKLLEVYLESKNLEAFDQYYGEILQAGDASSAARADDLRSQFPDAPAYEGASATPELDALLSETMDEEPEAEAPSGDDDNKAFSLDLDDELDLGDLSAEEPTQADTAESGSDELDSEFDFDLSDEFADIDSAQTEEPPATEESELDGSNSRYDLDFDSPTDDTEASESELSLDDLEFELPETQEQEQEQEPSSAAFDEDEPTAGLSLDDDLTLDLDAEQPDSALDVEQPAAAPEAGADSPSDEEVPTLDLADDDADDFDLDKAMDEFDVESLEREMDELDASETPASAPELDEVSTGVDDDAFEQALSDTDTGGQENDFSVEDLPTPETANSTEDALDDDLDFLADNDEVATKLDLARAYIDMGDVDGARDILSEVTEEGNEQQREDAQGLLARMES